MFLFYLSFSYDEERVSFLTLPNDILPFIKIILTIWDVIHISRVPFKMCNIILCYITEGTSQHSKSSPLQDSLLFWQAFLQVGLSAETHCRAQHAHKDLATVLGFKGDFRRIKTLVFDLLQDILCSWIVARFVSDIIIHRHVSFFMFHCFIWLETNLGRHFGKV